MGRRSTKCQPGFGVLASVVGTAFLALLAIIGVKVYPTLVEYRAVQAAADHAAQGGSPGQIEMAFERDLARRAISVVSGKDLEITKAGSRYQVGFRYLRRVAFFSTIGIEIVYEGSGTAS